MSTQEKGSLGGNGVRFMQYKDFAPSAQKLMSKGGKYQKAAETALFAFGNATSGAATTVDEVFSGIPLTNHGESRIAHCRKYDLTGYARLVTVYSNGICIFLFAGDHEATDKWLDANRGLDFIAHEVGGRQEIRPVFVSDTSLGKKGIIASKTDWLQSEALLDLLPQPRRDRLLAGLDDEVTILLKSIYSYTSEDEIETAVIKVGSACQAEAILDVLLQLRCGNQTAALNRIDLFTAQAKSVSELSPAEVESIVSSESAVLAADVDPVLFEHFVRTASFKDWMLYLHPAQRVIVEKEYAGPVRLAGVSGSGKTAVVIHRAMRLARSNPSAKVLVLTLNHALAKLIKELIQASSPPSDVLPNLTVTSVFELCANRLKALEPQKKDYYGTRTAVPNKYVEAEHIDDIWQEYFTCGANNMDADVMFEVVRTLLVRNIYPQEYLRQEFNYIRSAFAKSERDQYLDMDRVGRAIPLDRRYREMVQAGLDGWERKMDVVGAIDDLGVTDALYKHLASLSADFDHVLVDEVQDLGTLELRIIRALTKPGPNDLFLAGDAVQAVHTKYCDLKAAGIDLPSARWIRLKQNYRNSRQILTAAYAVLQSNLERVPPALSDMEVLVPEFANFSSAKPLLLEVHSVAEELTYALGYCRQADSMTRPDSKACIAICGMSQKSVEELGQDLGIQVLSDSTDLSGARLFISDLEQTKGFEFDLMLVINCAEGVIPQPQLPERESFRELCKLYVAMTRAKRELVVSYSGSVSSFLAGIEEHFSMGGWEEHEVAPAEVTVRDEATQAGDVPAEKWLVTGRDFLRTKDAVGLSVAAQEAILVHVTGKSVVRRVGERLKELEWKTFDAFFRSLLEDPRARNNIVSREVWDELESRFKSALPGNVPKALAELSSRPQDAHPAAAVEVPRGDVQPTADLSQGLVVFRNRNVRGYQGETLITHLLAVFMVATRTDRVTALEVGVPMRRDLLEYLLPRHILTNWQNKEWLRQMRTDAAKLVLTKSGVDVCRGWIGQGKWRPGGQAQPLLESRIEAFRSTILYGPQLTASDQFQRKVFS